MIRLLTLATALVALTGCGLKGSLETPPPLWGDPDRAPIVRHQPSRTTVSNDQVIFTQDDVDLFRGDAEGEDPFAVQDEERASQNAEDQDPGSEDLGSEDPGEDN